MLFLIFYRSCGSIIEGFWIEKPCKMVSFRDGICEFSLASDGFHVILCTIRLRGVVKLGLKKGEKPKKAAL